MSWSCSYLRTMLTTSSTSKKPVRWKAKKRRERRVDREPARAIQIKAI